MKLHLIAAAAASFAISLSPIPALAQSDFPARTIGLLVGFPPGGSTDVLSRVLAQAVLPKIGTF